MSNLNKNIYAKIDKWRHQRIEGVHSYVFLDGIVMKPSWAGEVLNVSLLVVIGVTTDGYRETLGIVEYPKEDSPAGRPSCITWLIAGSRAFI